MRWGQAELAVPCYPPDALALALRAEVPIYATSGALAHRGQGAASHDSAHERADMALWLSRVRPADFRVEGGSPRLSDDG